MSPTSDIILREHKRLVRLKTECIESDVKIICQDGEIRYSRILFYLMEPQYKLLLLDKCLEEEIVIINPSISVDEIYNFYDSSYDVEVAREDFTTSSVTNSKSPEMTTTNGSETTNDVEMLGGAAAESLCVCELCGQSYKTFNKLRAHKYNKHKTTSEEAFGCQECGKTFMHKFQLNKHKFVHQDASFVCATCLKKFKTRKSLVRHYDLFHGRSPATDSLIQCPECPAKFSLQSNLNRHLKGHSKCYKCSQCNVTFNRCDSLQRHLKLVHNV